MLRRLSDVKGVTVAATDGDLGSLHDIYFDDETWTVRYLVVDTGIWLGRLALVSVVSVDRPDWQGHRLPLHLSRREVEQTPDLLGRGPLTRVDEVELAEYYGYPFYWGGMGLWGWAGAPAELRTAPPSSYVPPDMRRDMDTMAAVTSIFSGREIGGYHIHATDGEIGHVDDFILDDETWGIRYLQVDTSNWIGGRTVLLATRWVNRVDPADGTLHVDLTRAAIENSPEYDPRQPLDRTFEERLHRHYGRPSYWETVSAHGAGRSLP